MVHDKVKGCTALRSRTSRVGCPSERRRQSRHSRLPIASAMADLARGYQRHDRYKRIRREVICAIEVVAQVYVPPPRISPVCPLDFGLGLVSPFFQTFSDIFPPSLSVITVCGGLHWHATPLQISSLAHWWPGMRVARVPGYIFFFCLC